MKVFVTFPGGKAKALTMSYDDGKIQDERLISIFNQYGIKGTFNLNYGLMGDNDPGRKPGSRIIPRVPLERVKEIYEGHEIATHTMTHSTIARCPMTALAREIMDDRAGLEQLSGRIVRGHAYPNGSYSPEIKQLFRELGIVYGRVVQSEPIDVNGGIVESIMAFNLPDDSMEWKATCHHNDPRLMKIAEMFANFKKRQYLKLMTVWGHSYEFDNNDNWEVIEEFCKYMGGREDIWYATNIEIFDYMTAYRNLQFSANTDAVYNPNAISVWVELNGQKIVEIPSGAYVDLNTML
ncbi:MAG: polysaccharide deacetylase [Lachnospiraceae bacterium]|nr:polysaccharide deacetylase [Lachnospiraceae bacterium]